MNKLGVEQLFRVYVSPFKLVYEPTGQVILFKGADNPKKLKSIKIAKGYLKIGWFEEVDQFSGMEEIRNIQQSIFRGTEKKQIAFFSYNPPKSARSWVNAEAKIQKPGRVVHHSTYLDVPREWLGETFLANAVHLQGEATRKRIGTSIWVRRRGPGLRCSVTSPSGRYPRSRSPSSITCTKDWILGTRPTRCASYRDTSITRSASCGCSSRRAG
jgi:hypothetical protein